jgi:glycosyltransferase involved in cell wall biosynthesis
MKKKILLYFPTDITKQANQSVYKKFLSQIKGFEKCGMDVDYIFHSGTDIIFNNEPIKFKYNISKKIISKLNPIIGYLLYFFSAIQFTKYELIFIRFKTSTPFIIGLLKRIRRQNKTAKIILEFPTYPYLLEFKGVVYKIYFKIEQLLCKQLSKYVNYSINYSMLTDIYNIKSIAISNGYNYEMENLEICKMPKLDNQIVLACMASSIVPCHGFDKILVSINNYLSQKANIKIIPKVYIIGEGPELPILKKYASDHQLNNYVEFTGFLNDLQLKDVLSKTHVCIGCMAMYRKNLFAESALKTAYYCFSGKPFILSATDERFPKANNMWKYLKNTDEEIDFNDVIEFTKNVYHHYPEINIELRNYAIANISWESQIKKMLQQINVA